MIRKAVMLTVLLLVALSGCTNQQIYDATQPKYDETQCMELPRSEYQECIQREPQSYEDYERERTKDQ
jgi:hypothetical protein